PRQEFPKTLKNDGDMSGYLESGRQLQTMLLGQTLSPDETAQIFRPREVMGASVCSVVTPFCRLDASSDQETV
ncbi:MAG: hypothetical protein O3C40_26640, partial [Planctomycetota bacterium]|nr:hypothetical protein [Planctomycetota bacterium]